MVKNMLGAMIAIAAALCAATPSIASETKFPERPITLLIPFPVGSGTDSTARVVAQEISQASGQSMIVDNKPGANGFIATRMAATAPADGYTVLMTSNTHYANKFLFKSLPYDPIGDFDTVAVVREPAPLVLVVGASSPYKTLDDLTRAAREKPGALTYASGNSSSRVGAELYKQLIDADILYVPYKGNAEGLNEVAAGRVDMIFSDVGAMRPMYEAGKVRPIAITGTQKLAFLKGVPTSAEAGLPELQIGSWGVVLAPKGTPEPVLEKLNQLFSNTIDTESVQRLIAATDGVPARMTRAEIDAFVNAEMEKWGTIIQKAGIPPQ
nr:tripartite tricarboxylate transporter substrate binding protein [Pseudomonas sp.]